MIRREGARWVLYSARGSVLGRSRSRTALLHRERQARFYANLAKSRGGRGSLLAKARRWQAGNPAL